MKNAQNLFLSDSSKSLNIKIKDSIKLSNNAQNSHITIRRIVLEIWFKNEGFRYYACIMRIDPNIDIPAKISWIHKMHWLYAFLAINFNCLYNFL